MIKPMNITRFLSGLILALAGLIASTTLLSQLAYSQSAHQCQRCLLPFNRVSADRLSRLPHVQGGLRRSSRRASSHQVQ